MAGKIIHLEDISIVNLYIRVYSCCVDEVAADHVNADGIIHFGTACLTV